MDIAIAAICAGIGAFLGAALWKILAAALSKSLDAAERRGIQRLKESAERRDDE